MCGLAVCFSNKGRSVGQQVFNLYKQQATRGKQGYGYLAIQEGKLIGVRRAKGEDEIKSLLMKEKAEIILFHHRFPTSTKNTVGTTHPIFVSHEELEFDYYIAHNGVINNASYLKGKHNGLGYKYSTEFKEVTYARYLNGEVEEMTSDTSVFNDSESLAIELARFIENKDEKVNTFGGAAFWGVTLNKGTNEVVNIFFGKNKGRDLKMFRNKKWFGVSSETGHNLDDMKLFTIPLNSPGDVYERDLIIDEAKPVTTTQSFPRGRSENWGRRSDHQLTLPVGRDIEDKDELDSIVRNAIGMYDNLKNKYYTLKEALDTGMPLSEFFATNHSDLPKVQFYVPLKYTANYDTRIPPTELLSTEETHYEWVDETDVDEKMNDMQLRLEAKCEEYIKVENHLDLVEEWYHSKKIDNEAYKNHKDRLESKQAQLENDMSSMGFDEDAVEKTLDVVRQLLDYEDAQRQMKLSVQLTDEDFVGFNLS